MKKSFSCTERELYALCLSGLETCSQNIDSLKRISPLYTPEYVETQKRRVIETMNSFDHRQRVAQKGKLRALLSTSAEMALGVWRRLRLYVKNSSDPDILKQNLNEMGLMYLEKAKRQQWEEYLKMLQSGQSYIVNNKAALLENQNMPESFEDEYAAAQADFLSKYDAYLRTTIEGKLSTENHIESLNEMYEDLQKMFAAGREAFADDKTKANLFRITSTLNAINNTGWAGIKGKVKDTQGNLAVIEGLEIEVVETDDLVLQEPDGSFMFNHMAAGTYTLLLRAPGYKEELAPVEVKTDTYTNIEIEMFADEVDDPVED
ncbi:MAG: carboxypeptidase-like regulatory domain-containing protein [Bacteroidia bacterium]